jgi:hypothetical protein
VVKDFKSFINEALALQKDGGAHYLERVKTRLNQLEVIGFTDTKGNTVSVSQDELNQVQSFYREALSSIADPERSKIFKDTDIKPGYIGILRLGKPKVILSTGEQAEPIFRVYERTDSSTGKDILRTGKCFWLFTIGSQVSTIKLYDIDGNTPSEKNYLIGKSIEHMVADRKAELAKISRVFSIKLDSPETLAKRHTVLLTPGGVSIVTLNLNSQTSIKDQLDDFINDSVIRKAERVSLIPVLGNEPILNIESVPKQMNITPDRVWVLERNDKFKTWGALPIIQSKQINGPTGNEIQIKLGKKWLHWLAKLDPPMQPVFNTPAQIDRILKKGDTVTLAKETGNGDWLVNTGVITDIATDARSSEFPYVKTNGWDSSEIINKEDAKKIFVDYRNANESMNPVLDFTQWQLINR